MSNLNHDQLMDAVAYSDRWIAYQQQLYEIPGVVAAVRYQDQTLLSQGYGFADIETRIPMTPQHIFRIASHSKTFTATAIMQLKEQSKLRLDDQIGTYIPWLGQSAGVASVTIRQLLNHSGGIVRDGSSSDYWQLEGDFPDSTRLRELVEDGGEVLAANEAFKYSNIGYSLLGLVIEAASGVPYNEYVTRHIVERLGLTDTGPETDSHAKQRLVTGYTPRMLDLPRVPVPDIETGAMSAATGFFATAEDLCRYATAHFLGNEELLSDASKREMQQPYWHVEQAETQYALGLAVITIGERRLIGHGGSFPGQATRTWFDPKDRLAVVVLTNVTGGPAYVLANGIIKIINFALGQPVMAPTETTVRAERFVGRFANMWEVMDVARFGASLFVLDPASDDPVKNVTELEIEDDDTLRITKTNGYYSLGESIRYHRDASGQVTKIIAGGATSYPEEIFRDRFLQNRAVSDNW